MAKKKLRVFEFSYEVDYGGGIMLIAAKDEERAKELCPKNLGAFRGYWDFSGEVKGLSYDGAEGEITSFTRVE
jgi:hypothetical protein